MSFFEEEEEKTEKGIKGGKVFCHLEATQHEEGEGTQKVILLLLPLLFSCLFSWSSCPSLREKKKKRQEEGKFYSYFSCIFVCGIFGEGRRKECIYPADLIFDGRSLCMLC